MCEFSDENRASVWAKFPRRMGFIVLAWKDGLQGLPDDA